LAVESAKSELIATLQKEAEAARRRSQRLVEIGKRMPNPHEQNELISMALAEGRAAETFDRAMEFLHEQPKS
jgi:hypothetical protein